MQFLLLSFAALLAVASAAGTLSGKISTYPGSTFGDVSGTVVLTDNWETGKGYHLFVASLHGFDANCTCATPAECDTPVNGCGIHIHNGTSCDSAAAVGGHFFQAPVTKDPWTAADGAYYTSRHLSGFVGETGYTLEANRGRAFVVHNRQGARIGCAVLH